MQVIAAPAVLKSAVLAVSPAFRAAARRFAEVKFCEFFALSIHDADEYDEVERIEMAAEAAAAEVEYEFCQ